VILDAGRCPRTQANWWIRRGSRVPRCAGGARLVAK